MTGPAKFFTSRSVQLPFLSRFFAIAIVLVVVQEIEATGDFNDLSDEYAKVRLVNLRLFHKNATSISETFDTESIGNHFDKISVEVSIDSQTVWLDLYANRELIPSGYFEIFQENGTDVVRRHTPQTTDLCHYKGRIRGRPESWAAVSTCAGISGTIFDGKHTHHLVPHNSTGQGSWYSHLVYPHDGTPVTDFTRKSEISSLAGSHPRNRVKRETNEGVLEPYNVNKKTRYVEMVIVVDNKKYKELGGDLKKTIQRSKEVCNIVNALYAPINIFIALVGVIVWNEVDQISLTQNGDDTLANFLRYRRERLINFPNDNAQLLTAVEFEKGVVGKAMQGPICSYQYSGGVNSDHKSLPGVVATTIAHELGHNFGLKHDEEKCECDGPGGRCIMSASSGSNRTSHWSSCSLEEFAYAFRRGMDYCLRNIPKALFKGPVCGNGFTEPGEECDCGLADFCNNPCCNAETCTLHKNATCGAGACCDLETCHVKPGGTVCRESTNTCDLPEFCTGEGEHCPADVYRLNGATCETPNGQAYCYEGKCRTHTDQCRLLWGPSGNSSHNLCYQKNTNGSRYGNCGYSMVNDTYKACKAEDTKCGLLQCKYYHEKLEFGYEPVSNSSHFFVHQQQIHACRSVTIDFGLQDVDPGLVPDGAKCGADKMCVSQKCVSVSTVMGDLECRDNCNNRGVCNSNGHCHCDEGYGGETCSSSGYGGSIDSGPSVNPYGAATMFAKALYITFVGFIPLISIVSFYIYYANDNFKKIFIYVRTFGRPSMRRGPKPDGGSSSRTMSTSETSSSLSGSSGNNNSKQVVPDDFFGTHKGFTLTPLAKPESPTTNGNTLTNTTTANNNKDIGVTRNVFSNAAPANIQSSCNSNVYYSPVPTQIVNEALVKNRNNEKPSLKSYTNNLLQKGISRVSWAQPVAQPLPTNSPTSEDEVSFATGSNIYENTHNMRSSEELPNEQSGKNHYTCTASTPISNGKEIGKSAIPTSRFSRITGAFPFMRNSLRNLGHSDDVKTSPEVSNKSSKNKKSLVISMPILQPVSKDAPSSPQPAGIVSAAVSRFEDEIDSCKPNSGVKAMSAGRYSNVPLIDESPSKETYTVDTSRLPKVLPSAPGKQMERKPVLRAHSMIQPSRNSVHNPSNPNFNSLRRNRPSVPPPKPPDVPPPPPPDSHPSNVVGGSTKARSESPPALRPKSSLRPVISPGNVSSILKMSLSRNTNRSPSPKRPESPRFANINRGGDSRSNLLSNLPSHTQDKQNDNIYDEIAETKKDSSKAEEKVETLSTGSSESAGGLLSEIIQEIQQRNKESIYNSVDRRKKKREAQLLNAEREKSNLSYSTSNRPESPKQVSAKSSPQSSPKSSPKMSPKFKYKSIATTQPGSKLKPSHVPSIAEVMNSSPVQNSSKNRSRSSSPLLATPTPSAYKPIAPPLPAANKISAPPLPATGPAPPIARPSSPPTSASSKPTCAVNGIPKITSSPSYVAKINYFSNLGSTKSDSPMKPLNSLNSAIGDGTKSLVSDIYSSSNVSVPEPTHLSTIRPTYARPYTKAPTTINEGSEGSQTCRTASSGEYGTLGRNRNKKAAEEKPEVKPSLVKEEAQQGYKPFNPYLNRPLTFSTFRPQSSPTSSTSSTTSTAATVSPPKSSPHLMDSIIKPAPPTGNISTSPYTKPSLIIETPKSGIRPPITVGLNRSPARVAQ